jgi:hypothetical protein
MNSNLINTLVSSTSYILKTIKQIIPIYEELNPIIKKLASLKNKINLTSIANTKIIKKEESLLSSSSNPQFFL